MPALPLGPTPEQTTAVLEGLLARTEQRQHQERHQRRQREADFVVESTRRDFRRVIESYRAPRLDRDGILVRYDAVEDWICYRAYFTGAPDTLNWRFEGRRFELSLPALADEGTGWCVEIWRQEVDRWQHRQAPRAADVAFPLAVDPGRPVDDRTAVYVYGGRRLDALTFRAALEQAQRFAAPPAAIAELQQRATQELMAQQERAIHEAFAVAPQYLGEAQRRLFEGGGLTAEDLVRAYQMLGLRPDVPRDPRLSREATARGETLLRQWLSPVQAAQYARDRSFEVIGCHTGARYRIRPASLSFNVDVLDDRGQPSRRLCFVPEGGLVEGDVMLAQKIALETDERAALKVANKDGGPEDLRAAMWGFAADRMLLQPMVVDSRAWTGLT